MCLGNSVSAYLLHVRSCLQCISSGVCIALVSEFKEIFPPSSILLELANVSNDDIRYVHELEAWLKCTGTVRWS